jgi:hypothetical protein
MQIDEPGNRDVPVEHDATRSRVALTRFGDRRHRHDAVAIDDKRVVLEDSGGIDRDDPARFDYGVDRVHRKIRTEVTAKPAASA